ncbi:MAG: hypothetical protein ACYC92_11945 [Candidatus Acidiferrales bacterium]
MRTPAQRKADQAAAEQARIATEKAAAEARIAKCLAEAAAREEKRRKEEWIARERAWKEEVEWVQATELHNLEIRLEREVRARGPKREPCPLESGRRRNNSRPIVALSRRSSSSLPRSSSRQILETKIDSKL